MWPGEESTEAYSLLSLDFGLFTQTTVQDQVLLNDMYTFYNN